MNLNNTSLVELTTEEMVELDGGGLIRDIYDVLKDVDKHWDDMKKRLKDGWDSYKPTCS